MTIPGVLERQGSKRPDAPAVNDTTYGELLARAKTVAAQLREQGICDGERVVIYAENSESFIDAYLGALFARAVAVPTNVLYRESDLARVIEDCDARAVAVSKHSRPFAKRATKRRLIDLDDVAGWVEPRPVAGAPLPTGDELAILIYTSGTTGRAKGAMLTHRNLRAIAEQVTTAWRWTSDDVLLLTLPLFHIHGLGAGLNSSIVTGGRLLLHERFDAGEVVRTLANGEATMFFGVPTMYVRLLESDHEKPFDRVRLFVSGSAALPASVHEAFERRFGASILERYGSTEFGFALTNRYDGPRHAGTVGFPFPGVDVMLRSTDGKPCPPGVIGEILVSGPNVCTGYWRNAEATSAAFVQGPDGKRWFCSGDLASFDPERGYTIAGRIKELIITGGFNVYPLEVEDELMRVRGVRAAAVIGKPDAVRGEIPIAFVEADDGTDEAAITSALENRLASFKVPKEVHRVDSLPRNAMGKVDKPQLRAQLVLSAGKTSEART